MAHTLREQRDLHSAKDVFDNVGAREVSPEMIDLAARLIQSQSGKYEPADLEDRYEARLREMIDAKVAGGHLVEHPEEQVPRDNVIDLVAALRKSLAEAEAAKSNSSPLAKSRAKTQAKPSGKTAPASKGPRKRAS
jgi:DNA end-binding protein Ku